MDAVLLLVNAALDSLVSRSLYCQLAKEPSAYLDDIWSSNDDDTDSEDDNPSEPGSRPALKKQAVNELKTSPTDSDATTVSCKDAKLLPDHKAHIAAHGR